MTRRARRKSRNFVPLTEARAVAWRGRLLQPIRLSGREISDISSRAGDVFKCVLGLQLWDACVGVVEVMGAWKAGT